MCVNNAKKRQISNQLRQAGPKKEASEEGRAHLGAEGGVHSAQQHSLSEHAQCSDFVFRSVNVPCNKTMAERK